MPDVRIPKQKSAIEKRNRIIEKGFELMCEKGYHNVSTPDIAKASGVSTGIIYQYFTDKKDIFIEGVKNYSNSILFPILSVIEKENIKTDNIEILINKLIDNFVNKHKMSKKAHEELIAMSHLDDDVAKIFKDSEFEMTKKIVQVLENNNIILENPLEKIHIVYNIIDNFCHETVYHKHNEIDYNAMKNEVIKIVENILKQKE